MGTEHNRRRLGDRMSTITEKTPTRSTYGQGNIFRRGNIWWIRYRRNGVQYRESTETEDRQKALDKLNDRLADRSRRVIAAEKVTYQDLRRNYLEHCEEKDPPMKTLLYDKERNPTLATLPRLDEAFETWRANQITAEVIRRFRREGRHDGLSNKRLNRYVTTLSAMFHWGLKDGMISQHEMPSYFERTPERNEAVGAIYIEPEWYEPLRKELGEPLRSAFTLAYKYGIRVEEMKRLRWRDFDFKNKQIFMPGERTKTGEKRTIPIPSDFDREPGKPDELVFPLGDRRDQWRSATVKIGAAWFECRECGARCEGRECPEHGHLPIKKMVYRGPSLRNCRHTAVRDMEDAGLEQKRIMDITGHKTSSMFERYDIGKQRDVADARKAIEAFHKKRQQKLSRLEGK